MKVLIVGDTHGRWDDFRKQIALSDADVILQVGDFGHHPTIGSHVPPNGFGRDVYFIDGNHENHPDLQLRAETNNLEVADRVFYVPRGTQLEFGSKTFNCCGGAMSSDRSDTTKHVDWFDEEVCSYREISRFANLPPADYIVTHTSPEFVMRENAHFKINDPVARDFESLVDNLGYKPQKWFFGHWHTDFRKSIGGIEYVCVPSVHDHYHWKDGQRCPIKGFSGYEIFCD